jgi:hypothetical protein
MAVLLLLHIPPVVALLKEVVAPTHTEVAPTIADGTALTVTTVPAKHPEGIA